MSKLQKWCPNYPQGCTLAKTRRMSLQGAMQYAPRLSAPRCPASVMAPNILGEYPALTPRYCFCVYTCLLQGNGGQKL